MSPPPGERLCAEMRAISDAMDAEFQRSEGLLRECERLRDRLAALDAEYAAELARVRAENERLRGAA